MFWLLVDVGRSACARVISLLCPPEDPTGHADGDDGERGDSQVEEQDREWCRRLLCALSERCKNRCHLPHTRSLPARFLHADAQLLGAAALDSARGVDRCLAIRADLPERLE